MKKLRYNSLILFLLLSWVTSAFPEVSHPTLIPTKPHPPCRYRLKPEVFYPGMGTEARYKDLYYMQSSVGVDEIFPEPANFFLLFTKNQNLCYNGIFEKVLNDTERRIEKIERLYC